jgi:putative transposase
MDFTLDTLADGRAFRTVNIVGDFTRECITIEVDRSLSGLARHTGAWATASDARAAAVDRPGQRTGVCRSHAGSVGVRGEGDAVLHPPRQAVENAYVESFNGKFRDECLNEHWFVSLADAQEQIEAWRVDYNTVRPHGALGDQTPQQFAESKVGARRLTPARLNNEQTPRHSHYPCSGNWGQVSATET